MSNENPLRIYCRRDNLFGDGIAVRMGFKQDTGMAIAQPIQYMFQGNDAGYESMPAFTLDRDAAQAMMDELWHCGVRPTEGTGSAGSLAATQSHLKDMRAIVAKSLNIELK